MDDDMGSLFEGMVLFTPSQIPKDDLSPPPPSSPLPEPPSQQQPPPSQEQQPPPPSLSSSSSAPLDENLFSDLTLITPSIDTQPDISTSAATSTALETVETTSSSINRQVSRRKKKAGIKIGYGRDTSSSIHDGHHHQQLQPSPSPSSQSLSTIESNSHSPIPLSDSVPLSTKSESPAPVASSSLQTIDAELPQKSSLEDARDEDGLIPEATAVADATVSTEEEEEDVGTVGGTVEEKLEKIRAQIEEKLKGNREMAASVSAARKEYARKRRKAGENVNLASLKYKELEKELEEACEAEDFERAEGLSEKIAAVEKEKEGFMNELRDAEANCDAVDSKMQEVLELQIKAEEEGVMLLEQFAKDAADNASLVLKNAEEFSSREMNEWFSSVETLEVKKMELEIVSHLINDARLGLNDSIEHTVEDDVREKEILCEKRKVLAEELEKLLALVRQKEAEIAENDSNIQEIEKRIAGAVSGFHDVQSSIDAKYNNMQSALSEIDSESEALSAKKKEIDEYLSQEEKRAASLKKLISVTMDEAKNCQELVALRKSLSLPILKYREVKVRLAKTEEKILEDVQSLRQEVSGARTSLQELSAARSSIQQEIATVKQRIFFIDKRIPELEAEKKVAAAARNFKEAGRIAAEAKTLGVEKETIQTKLEADVLQLQNMEEQINETIKRLNETEELILLKEKEAAMAGCERQRLVAAAAMAERSAALEIGDHEEANTLCAEAEAADYEATKFQQAYNLKDEEFESIAKNLISIDLIASLGGEQLAKMAASLSAA